MAITYKILILGASYGSLLGAKMALAGHTVKLVCLPEEVALINAEGARVRMPAKGVDGLVELNTKTMPGDLSAAEQQGVRTRIMEIMTTHPSRAARIREVAEAAGLSIGGP